MRSQSWGIQRFFQGQPAIRRKSSVGSLTGIIRRISTGVGISVSRTATVVRTASRYTIAEELLPRTTSRRAPSTLHSALIPTLVSASYGSTAAAAADHFQSMTQQHGALLQVSALAQHRPFTKCHLKPD